MRIAAVEKNGKSGMAACSMDGVWHACFEGETNYPGSVQDLVLSGGDALRTAGQALLTGPAISIDEGDFRIPVPKPSKIICVGLNYADHSKESGSTVPTYPTLFARFSSSLIPHGTPLMKSRLSDQFDYEGEIVAIIGKGGRYIANEMALEHMLGYSLFNDASVRDYQMKTPQWTVGKNFDGTGAFGPYIVTADELPAGTKGLRLQTRLNGQIVQDATMDDLIFDVATLVSTLSEAFTLETGDLIITGTPAGVGLARKPPLWMEAGDVCEIELEKFGVLRNMVVAELAA